MVSIGSPLNRFKMVVLPALSSPLKPGLWAHVLLNSNAFHLTAWGYEFPSLWSVSFSEWSVSPWCVYVSRNKVGLRTSCQVCFCFSSFQTHSLMLTWRRSITTCIQKNAFHTSKAARIPPRRSNISNTVTSRWGSFERITPASLASVDVTTFPRRPVPDNIPRPSYAAQGLASSWESDIPCLSTQEQIQGLKNACQVAKNVLTMGGKMCLVSDPIDWIMLTKYSLMHHHLSLASPLKWLTRNYIKLL